VIDVFTLITLAVAFLAYVLLVFGLVKLWQQRQINRRLQQTHSTPSTVSVREPLPAQQEGGWQRLLVSMSKLSVPDGDWQNSQLRLKFIRAGFRGPTAAQTYFSIKTILTLILPLLVALLIGFWSPATPYPRLALYAVSLAGIGYYLPDIYLRWMTGRRSDEMRDTLPDLIDLLVICTEAGLGMDGAINRVSLEIARSSKILAEEFNLAALEIRAGSGRSTALKNLALRVNLEDLDGLVSMLVQADRFGTSVAESLRIQSEVMRMKRMQRAEEIAAKVPVKMLIPLIFFIFPALLSVLIGPAVIQISAMFSK
jgi:tight adherence protein C